MRVVDGARALEFALTGDGDAEARAGFVELDDEAAVGLAEELEQVVDDLRQQLVEFEGAAEVADDLQQAA